MEEQKKKKDDFRRFLRVFLGRGMLVKISLCIVFLFVFAAVFAPVITKYSPTEQDLLHRRAALFSEGHFLGTDKFGRDIYTRLVYGARTSLTCSLLSSIWASIVGSLLGIIAGYFEGKIGRVIMGYIDAQLSIPALILSMTLATILGKNIFAIAIVIGIGSIPGYARVAYSNVLSIKENDYILASDMIGQSKKNIILKHLFPNCMASLIVIFTMSLGQAIMVESSLAYLGVGLSEPMAAWGIMVADGFAYLTTHPSMALLPGFCIMLIVVAFNVIGDGLRDALDPKLRGKL